MGRCIRPQAVKEDKVFSGDEIRNNYDKFIEETSPFYIDGYPWNKMFDIALIRENNIRFPRFRRLQDSAFLIRYLDYVNKVMFMSESIYIYYENSLKTIWDKYPVDFINYVIGLNNEWQKIALRWNENNTRLKAILQGRYVSRIITSMELVFSPKAKLSNDKEKKKKMLEYIEESGINNFADTYINSRYQRMVLKLVTKGKTDEAYNLIKFKTFLDKHNLLHFFVKG